MPFKQIALFVFIFLFSITACKKVDIQFGTPILDNQYTQIVKTDTFSASLSTVFVDSFVTSGTGVTLLGGYTDTSFGRIDTKCYFEFAPPSNSNNYDSTRFDSLYLILKLNRSYYGDTTKPLHLDVRRLSQQIQFPVNSSSFYNVNTFPVNQSILGSTDVLVQPKFYTDSIVIRLSNNLGKEFLSKLKDKSDQDMQNTSNFLYYFNGLCISSNPQANMILNCTDNITMRLCYNRPGVDSVEKYHTDFNLFDKQHHFNNITVNRSGLQTALKNIGHNSKIPSSSLNNKAYCQYSSGVLAKISFPTLTELLKVPNYIKILSATLKVFPVKRTYDTYYYLPPSLNLYQTDINNSLGTPLSGISSSGSYTTQSGNLYVDYIYGDKTSYSYDVSSYNKYLIENPAANIKEYGLLLAPPGLVSQTQFERVVIGDKYYPDRVSNTVLEINYLTVQPQ